MNTTRNSETQSQIRLHERVTAVEQDLKGVAYDVEKIMTNHLPHIQSDLSTIKDGMNKAIGALVVLQFLLNVALAIYLK